MEEGIYSEIYILHLKGCWMSNYATRCWWTTTQCKWRSHVSSYFHTPQVENSGECKDLVKSNNNAIICWQNSQPALWRGKDPAQTTILSKIILVNWCLVCASVWDVQDLVHPTIIFDYILGGCTGDAQPCDDGIQQPSYLNLTNYQKWQGSNHGQSKELSPCLFQWVPDGNGFA